MPSSFFTIKMARMAALACLLVSLVVWTQRAHSQTSESKREVKGQDQPEVLRVYTELVQTDVMVFDKQGRFVNGLKREDFELRIDGKPRPVEFFEMVTAGTLNEESQIAAARGSSAQTKTTGGSSPIPLDRGRPVYF